MSIEPVVLENAFVRLEPLDERHREPLREAGNDPDLWRFANVNLDNADFDAWMDHRFTEMKRAGEMTWAVFDKASGSHVGSTSYLAVVLAHKRLEIGWTWYAKRVWAGPVNPSCKRMLLAHGFDVLGLNRLELKGGRAQRTLVQGDGAVRRDVRGHPSLAHGPARWSPARYGLVQCDPRGLA